MTRKRRKRTMRLPNGAGSIAYLGKNYRKPWATRKFTGEYTPSGSKKYKYLAYFKTEMEAYDFLMSLYQSGTKLSDSKMDFSDAYPRWIEHKKKEKKMRNSGNGLSEDTLYGYENIFNNHCQSIHKMSVYDIDHETIQGIIDKATSYSMASKIRSMIKQIFDYLMALKVVSHNPAIGTTAGKDDSENATGEHTQDEIDLLWENTDMPFVDVRLIMLYTGMRRVDVLNLENKNIKLKERYFVTGSKTEAGKDRVIPIHKKIHQLIENRMSDKQKWLLDDHGNPMSIYQFDRRWDKVNKALNITHTSHTGRITFVSRSDRQDLGGQIQKMIVGHSIKDLTKRVYTKKTIADLIDWIDLYV